MLQRVMIAAALLTEPLLLLADEPTTALDVTTQAEVMAILDELRREFGLAMLFITHDLELAAAICDRTAVMYAGQVVEIRASDLLHDDPLHPYTAALAAARPDITQTRARLRAIPGRPLSAFEAPPGQCAFAPRCPHAADTCREQAPALTELDGGLSRCARAAELRGVLEVAVELVSAVIARAEAVEPAINAFAATYYEQALEAATQAEARYASRGAEPRPLEGLPVAVKEEAPIAGRPNTLGSLPLRDVVADQTAVFVQRIIDAGGIVHAQTTTPEFSCAHEERFGWLDVPACRPPL
jgi:oligopeptide/dipeptide ABC transporter ATP-binding protein